MRYSLKSMKGTYWYKMFGARLLIVPFRMCACYINEAIKQRTFLFDKYWFRCISLTKQMLAYISTAV